MNNALVVETNTKPSKAFRDGYQSRFRPKQKKTECIELAILVGVLYTMDALAAISVPTFLYF